MNGFNSHNVMATSSVNFNPQANAIQSIGDAPNDQQAMEALLVIVFSALANCYPGAPKEVQDAFVELTQIMRRYVACILAFFGIPSPSSMAEDIVQDVFVRFLTRDLARHYHHQLASRRAFLLGVLRHVLSEAIRKHKPGRTMSLADDKVDPSPHSVEAMAMREIRDEINSAINRLGPALGDAIRAQYGFVEQSAAIAGLTPSARNTRTSRARQLLRWDLKERLAL